MGSLVAELAENLSSATNNLDFDEQTLFLNTSADTVGIGTNSPGAKLDVRGSALFNEGGDDVDFRIEGDTQTHLFFLDASTDRIGINSATPGVQFDVVGATKITGATTHIGALTVGVDDTGHDVIFYGASASTNMTWDQDGNTDGQLILNDAKLFIDQDDDDVGIVIDCESANQSGMNIYAKYGMVVEQDIAGGWAANFSRNIAEAGSHPLVSITNDHTSDTAGALKITQDGAGYGLNIDQNGNQNAILIDAENTTASVLQIEADTLTTGSILNIYSASSSTATRNLVRIWNDNASSTDTTALYVLQDSSGDAAVFEGGNIRVTKGGSAFQTALHHAWVMGG